MSGFDPVICAIMATMNRAKVPIDCVKALAAQTRTPEMVVVADNHSTDDTVEALRALNGLPFDLIVHCLPKNLGNAGGIEEAMTLAFEKGADAVWILDDDSWPRPDALEQMLLEPWDPVVVRHSLQVHPGTDRFTWPLPLIGDGEDWVLINRLPDLPPGPRLPSHASWTGALISKEIFHAVGPVMGELFIRGEDEEYPWRISRAGFSFQAITGSILDHPGPPDLIHWKFMGKNLFLEKELTDFKLYYKIRNMVWLKRKQLGGQAAILMAAGYLAGFIWLEGPSRLPLLLKAARHGWLGTLGEVRF